MFTSKDHATAQMVRHPPDHAAERERFVEDLLAIMSVAEKAGQLVLLPIPEAGGDSEGAPLRAEMLQGRVGGLLGSGAADQLAALQRLAVEETRLGIPLLMANVPGRGTSVTMPAPLARSPSVTPGNLPRFNSPSSPARSASAQLTSANSVNIEVTVSSDQTPAKSANPVISATRRLA